MSRKKTRRRSQMPTDAHDVARVIALDHLAKRHSVLPHSDNHHHALTPEERRTIAAGRRACRTWNEINSTKGGGRDLGAY